MKIQRSQKWPYFLLDNQNWALHAKFQHLKLKNDRDTVIQTFFFKSGLRPNKIVSGPTAQGVASDQNFYHPWASQGPYFQTHS